MAAVLCASCSQEIRVDEPIVANKMEIGLGLPTFKSALGEKDEDAYPNLWQEGDKISVNGKTSDGLDAQYDGKSSAVFTVEESSAPYYIAFPSSAVSDYDNGTACITIPENQEYIEGTYDPKAFVMISNGNDPVQELNPAVSFFHLRLAGDATISSVTLEGEDTDVLSGKFTTDFEALTASDVKNSVTMSGEVELPADFFVCIPAGEYTNLSITIVGNDGTSMTKKAGINTTLTAGKMYGTPELAYTPDNPVLTISDITSSTANLAWGTTNKNGYKIGVYEDEGCENIVRSYTIPAGDACWNSKAPKFCVSGLQPGTTYYARVDNLTKGVNGEVAEFATCEFTNVAPGTTAASVGDILLAEDFGQLEWGGHQLTGAAGWSASETSSFTPGSEVGVSSYLKSGASEILIGNYNTTAVNNSRLATWAQETNSVYIHPGYLKLSETSRNSRIITPELTNIPEGTAATVEVTVTASRYDASTSRDALIGVVKGTIKNLPDTKANTIDIQNFENVKLGESPEWGTYTVTLSGVEKGDRIVFGPGLFVAAGAGKMNISDISVKLTATEDIPSLKVSCTYASSSTLVFTWTNGGTVAEDVADAYEFTPYKDKECTKAFWSTRKFSAGQACWNNKRPKFVVPGLTPATSYYIKVKNTTRGTTSAVLQATTKAFDIVTMPESITANGVVLAEDFGEFLWSYDYVAGAAGFTTPKANRTTVSSFVVSAYVYSGQSDVESTLTTAGAPPATGTRLETWKFTSLYIHPGYCKFGTAKACGGILTPAFTVPEGKVAKVDVTVTCAKFSSDSKVIGVTVIPAASVPSALSEFTVPAASQDIFQKVTLNSAWTTTTLKGFEVRAGDRIYFGHKAGTAVDYARSQLNDIKVTVTEISDAE